MLPYIVLAAAVVYFIAKGMGWLDDLAERRSSSGGSGPWREIQPDENAQDRRLEVFRQYLDSENGEAGGESPSSES